MTCRRRHKSIIQLLDDFIGWGEEKKKRKHIVNLSIGAYLFSRLSPCTILIETGISCRTLTMDNVRFGATSCYQQPSQAKLPNEICRSVKHQLKDECRFKGLCETITDSKLNPTTNRTKKKKRAK